MNNLQAGIFSLMLGFCAAQAAAAAQVEVIDGDSLFVDGKEIRLSGIDAPEYHQNCYDDQNRPWKCGKESRLALVRLAGKDISCRKIVTDRYHRQVAVCHSRGININQAMVGQGWAVAYDAYTTDYIKDEKTARQNRRGIWRSGKFMRPEVYRALQR